MTAGNDEQELRRDIERTREQLGDTVEQLVSKADLRARAGQLAGRVKRGVPLAAGAAATLLGTYLLLRWWRSE